MPPRPPSGMKDLFHQLMGVLKEDRPQLSALTEKTYLWGWLRSLLGCSTAHYPQVLIQNALPNK